MALNIDSAIWRARSGNTGFRYPVNQSRESGPVPMEIGNFNSGPSTRAVREQRKKDLEKGACFKCHKVGCRPWKCSTVRTNNTEMVNTPVAENFDSQSDSKNE